MFHRADFYNLSQRILEERKFIQVLSGPRQVGKTTLVQQILHQTDVPNLYVSADGTDMAHAGWLEQQWEVARIKYHQQGKGDFIMAIDEVQKISNWSEVVKKMWDEDSREGHNIKVIILGSSRLLMQQGLTESLAGRFENTYISHWTFDEMQKAFSFTAEQYAWFGGYPGAASLIGDEMRWKNYVTQALIESSISRDILMLTRVDKPALMKRLFELGCAYSGQILSYNKILGQLLDAGNTTTLSHYLQLLDTAGLLCGLEKFSPHKIRQRASSPKFQVHNTSFISAQSNFSFNEAYQQKDYWGRIVENAVGVHLLNHALKQQFSLYYWREGNDEIDFVLAKGDKVIGLEVKSGPKTIASGSLGFKKMYPKSRIILIDNKSLHWQEFLEIDPMSLF